MHALLGLLADPLNTRALSAAYQALHELDHPAARLPVDSEDGNNGTLKHFATLLNSVHTPESLLFPWEVGATGSALPAGVATAEEIAAIERFAAFVRTIFDLRPLPVDDLALALGDELFAYEASLRESDLAIAYQIANVLRRWYDLQPDWRLPELAAELEAVASGRRSLPLTGPGDLGFEPAPGRITLTTQHSAKGLEWDAVFLVGIDGFWVPNTLDAYFLGVHDFLGGDPTAEAAAQLRYLMHGHAGGFPGRNATESAHIEIISERLRLLYVGITRARRFLQISRSRTTRHYNREKSSEPTTVIGVLYDYLRERET